MIHKEERRCVEGLNCSPFGDWSPQVASTEHGPKTAQQKTMNLLLLEKDDRAGNK